MSETKLPTSEQRGIATAVPISSNDTSRSTDAPVLSALQSLRNSDN